MHLFIRFDVIVGSQRERYANVRKGSHDLYLRTVEFVNVNWQGASINAPLVYNPHSRMYNRRCIAGIPAPPTARKGS